MTEYNNLDGLVVGEEEMKAVGRAILAGAHAGVNFDHSKTMSVLTMAVSAEILSAAAELGVDRRILYASFCDSLVTCMSFEEQNNSGEGQKT